MSEMPFAVAPIFGLLATTATNNPNGFALQNGTPVILSWTAPNDGQLHRVSLFSTLDATSAETGGIISLTYTAPDGNGGSAQIYPGGQTGVHTGGVDMIVIKPGSTVSLVQTALTAGAAVLWAEIWGS